MEQEQEQDTEQEKEKSTNMSRRRRRSRSSKPVIVLAGDYPALLSDARGSAWSAKLEKGQDQADAGEEAKNMCIQIVRVSLFVFE